MEESRERGDKGLRTGREDTVGICVYRRVSLSLTGGGCPSRAATAVLSSDGWLRTGDVGQVRDGRLNALTRTSESLEQYFFVEIVSVCKARACEEEGGKACARVSIRECSSTCAVCMYVSCVCSRACKCAAHVRLPCVCACVLCMYVRVLCAR